MAKLDKNDFQKLKEAILNFRSLTAEQQKVVTDEVGSLWGDIVSEYSRRCAFDEELTELYNYIEDFRKVTNFSIEEHYKKYTYTFDEFDPAESKEVYDYDLNALLTAQDIYEHLDEYVKILNSKIEKLQNSRFAINKENRIKKIQIEIKKFEDTAAYYGKLKEQDDLKNEYMKTRFETYTKNKEKMHELTSKHANEVLCESLKFNPEIICLERNSACNNTVFPIYDKYALVDAFNNIKKQVVAIIKKENEENLAAEKEQ